jgi:HD-GYP domain-containing protein (c-di-GMP phosphodiesterase class II)
MTNATPINEAVRHLSTALANACLYAPQHPQVIVSAEKATAQLEDLLAQTAEVKLVLVDEVLFHDGIPLGKDLFGTRLVQAMKGRGIGFLQFLPGIRREEIITLVSLLSGQPDVTLPKHVRFGSVELDPVGGEERLEISSFETIPKERMDYLTETYRSIARRGKVALSGLTAIVAGFMNAFRKEANPFLALAPLRAIDEYSFTHSINVGILNLAQGMSLRMEGQLLHDVGIAGMLHDAGKLHISAEVIRKPEEFTREEWEAMKLHSAAGAGYLLNQPGIPRLAVLAAFEHHLGHDASGYPRVGSEWKPTLCSEMTMISDCFDALRTRRVYQEPSDFEKTAGIMLDFAGSRLHPALTMNFLKVLYRQEAA